MMPTLTTYPPVTSVNKKLSFDTIATFVAFCCFLTELPISALVALQDNLNVGVSTVFNSFRLYLSFFTIAVCSLNLFFNRPIVLKSGYFWAYVFFILYIASVVVFNGNLMGYRSGEDPVQTSAINYFQPIIFKHFLFFLLGLYVVGARRWRHLLLFVLFVSMVSFLPYVSLDGLSIDRTLYSDDAKRGNYQFIGDAFAVSSLLVLAWYPHTTFRFVFATFTAVILFLIGSRTSFILFVGVYLAYMILVTHINWFLLYLVAVIVLIVAAGQVDYASLAERNPRMLNIFTYYGDDSSVLARQDRSKEGWEDIRSHPFTGVFGGQLEYGGLGAGRIWTSYMHDVYSYWRQFGILGILPFFAFTIRLLWMLFLYLPIRKSSQYAAIFLPAVFLTTESLFSRSFTFSMPHLAFGLALALFIVHMRNKAVAFESSSSREKAGRWRSTSHVGATGHKRRRRRRSQ